jgi:8-oxo-dGTP pyrophosphatase MutT (NUDIX family)
MIVDPLQKTEADNSYRYLTYWNPTESSSFKPEICVVTCFLHYEDSVLVLQRARKDGQHLLWGIPGGKLDKDELPIPGLIREIYEETRLKFKPTNFQLLGTALSKTHADGQYGLYLYHCKLANRPSIEINAEEHYGFLWIKISDFKKLNLLTAQGEAFDLIRGKLQSIIYSTKKTKEKSLGKKRKLLGYA